MLRDNSTSVKKFKHPYLQGNEKALKELGYNDIVQASQTVPRESIAQKYMEMEQQLGGETEQNEEQSKQENDKNIDILAKLLNKNKQQENDFNKQTKPIPTSTKNILIGLSALGEIFNQDKFKPGQLQQDTLSQLPDSPESKAKVLSNLLQQTELRNKQPGGIADQRLILSQQQEQRRLEQEDRRIKQMEQYNKRTMGGKFTSADLQDPEYGFDLNSTIEAYGIPAEINPKTGERTWTIPPQDVLKQKAQQMPVREKELEFFNDTFDAVDTANEIVSGLKSLGVQDPSQIGSIQEETINSELGPFSIPARFNLAGQYAKDPKYTALKSKLERLFQKYRKITTGAQASNQELATLRPLIASFTQRPGVFFSTVSDMSNEGLRMLGTRLESMKSVGRKVSELEKVVNKRKGGTTQQIQAVPQVGGEFNGEKVINVRRIK